MGNVSRGLSMLRATADMACTPLAPYVLFLRSVSLEERGLSFDRLRTRT
jgi:hypothetical protein